MFRKTLVSRALSVAFGTTVLSVAVGPVAFAQSNATGGIAGRADVVAGNSVTAENLDTGARRTATITTDGRFFFNSLPPGRYKVSLVKEGAVIRTQDNIEVLIGTNAEVSFASSSASLDAVQVSGRRRSIDVQNTNSGVTFSASQIDNLPIARSVSALIQLAPNATRGDTRYGGVDAPSIGGASSSENSYYINGYPVTNILFQVGFSQLPFNSISQAQILAGGYGAEFGRSIGGVVNITTKSGGNNWEAGGQVWWEPKSLRSKEKNSNYDTKGKFPALDGKPYFYNQDNTRDAQSFSAYIGGPLIKDKLFFFFSGEQNETRNERTRLAADTTTPGAAWESRTLRNPRSLIKFDWNVTDDHHVEFTSITDSYSDNRRYSGFNYTTLQRNYIPNGGQDYKNWGPTSVAAPQGAALNIAKYTGYLTDNFTVTALYGQSRQVHDQTPVNFNAAFPQIVAAATDRAPGLSYVSPQGVTGDLNVPGAVDKQTALRIDAEYKLNKHSIRFGIDSVRQKSLAGSDIAGGSIWTYQHGSANVAPVVGGLTPAAGGGLGADGYYVFQTLRNNVQRPEVIQAAQYIEDRWQVTDRVLLSLGLRNEQFDNKNDLGKSYIKQMKQLEPRVGASWDVRGDQTLKLFGNFGRYHVPIPTSIALRGAGASLNTQQYYTYTGVDPVSGVPTGLRPISGVTSGNGEFGIPRDARTVTDQNLKAMYQDELSLGMEQALARDLNVGVKGTYRRLGTAIDDWCDDRPFQRWAAANGYGTGGLKGECFLVNPGRDATFQYDVDGNGTLETVRLNKKDMGLERADRRYLALDFFAEHPFNGKWYGKVNYTWSKNWGNTEGQLLSDLGQADVGATQTWDYPEFQRGATGLLPNNRRHQIKAFGYYQLTEEWGLGANLLMASGRPKNCKGVDTVGEANLPYFGSYTSPSFFCNGAPTSRGSAGTLPWDMRLDMNVAYKPTFLKGVMFKLDVFNLFNRQSAEVIEERYQTASGAARAVAGRVVSYTAPRYVRLTAAYDYKF